MGNTFVKFELFILLSMSRLLTLFILLPVVAFGSTAYDTLYINHGTVQYASFDYHFLAFNNSDEATAQSHPIYWNADTLVLTVFNRDSISHALSIDPLGFESEAINPLESQTIELTFDVSDGVYRLYCSSARGWLLGASTILLKGHDDVDSRYFWNLFDQEFGMDTLIVNGMVSSLPILGYRPSAFTINGNIYPNTVSDSTAMVHNAVDDEIIIAIANSGKMDHTLHFHGFHITVFSASIDSYREGWIKDTFNVSPGETMTIKLVPHQHGHYPVHNHNLIAVNTGGYPGGMITMLHIEP